MRLPVVLCAFALAAPALAGDPPGGPTDVMPEFRDRHEARQGQKAERLAPCIERALARRTAPPESAELPVVRAYGRNPASGDSK